MSRSIIDPLACGFMKAVIYQLNADDARNIFTRLSNIESSKRLKTEFEVFQGLFPGCQTSGIDYEWYRRNYSKIKQSLLNLGKASPEKKKKILTLFGKNAWLELDDRKRDKHKLFDCRECLKNHAEGLRLFPVRRMNLNGKKKAKKSALYKEREEVVQKIAEERMKELDKEFMEKYNWKFKKAACLESNKESREKERKLLVKAKKDIEKTWKKTSVMSALGGTTSKAAAGRVRKTRGFESYEAAFRRSNLEIEEIATGKKRAHSHVGKNYSWKSEECLEKVLGLPYGSAINFTKLAREFELRNGKDEFPGNAGQVIRTFLETNGVDIGNFVVFGNNTRRIRKAKLRILDSDVTVPVEESTLELNANLKSLIEEGRYSVGKLVVPQEYEYISIMVLPDGKKKREKKTFVVSGRKFKTQEVRNRMLRFQRPYLRIKPDEFYESMDEETLARELSRIGEEGKTKSELKVFQRQRTLACWHDTSGICNASHLHIMFCTIYDQAIFLSQQEYFEKTGINVCVQSEVEKPVTYLLSRCPSSNLQLCYSELRLEDLVTWNNTEFEVTENIKIVDRVRFFKGDGPACQLEAGHQKGGNYYCWCCDMKANRSTDLTYVFGCVRQSLQDKINRLTKTSYGKQCVRNKKLSILEGIPKEEVIEELRNRDIPASMNQNKEIVLRQLEDVFAGVQHLPAVLFESGRTNLEEVGLESYEVLGCDPLHTFKGLTTNIYQEIPRHLEKKEKDLFKESANASFHGKEAKNGGDYRRSLVDLTIYLDGEMTDSYVKLMRQLAELQEIAYSGDEKRTAKSILRFHNVSFMHADLMIDLFKTPKSMSSRKLFGQYYHSLTSHAPIQYRILDLISANTEQEEAAFNFMKEVSKHASNHHPDNILLTSFLRVQIREDWERHLGSKKKERRNVISKHGDLLKLERSNTFVPFKLMQLKPRKWQSQLERICDYLLIEGIWEEIENGIIFHDLDDVIKYPSPHHFRSWTIDQERKYLADIWDSIEDKHIPAFIKIDISGKRRCLSTLKTPNPFQLDENLESEEEEKSLERSEGENDKDDDGPLKLFSESEIEEETYLDNPGSGPSFKNDQCSLRMSTPRAINGACVASTSMQFNDSINIDEPEIMPNTPFLTPMMCSASNKETSDKARTPRTPVTPLARMSLLPKYEEKKKDTSTEVPTSSSGRKSRTESASSLERAVEITKKPLESKTSKLLVEVFGEDDVIMKYLETREKYKRDNVFYKDLYNNCVAQLEVKFVCKINDLEEELERMEISLLSEDSISIKFGSQEEKNQYTKLKNEIRIIHCLKKKLIN